jgi:hypothetical protein
MMRPHGLGWVEGVDSTPVEVPAEPPIEGPESEMPHITGEDPREVKKSKRDPRAGKGSK